MREWLRNMAGERGYGSLVWMKNGSIADYEPFVAAAGIRDISLRTGKAFE